MCENLPISILNEYNTTWYEHSSVLLVILPLRGIYSYFKLLPIKNFAARAKRKTQWIKCLASEFGSLEPRQMPDQYVSCLQLKPLEGRRQGFPKQAG